MLTLAIDTSTMVGGVALLDDDILVAEQIMNVSVAHSERLMSCVESVISGAGIVPRDIGAIACGIGPGSFTGVRIGVSAAKGMAYALGVPMAGVSALDALAYGRGGGCSAIWSLIDARHERCYSASFRPLTPWGVAEQISDYAIMDVSSVVDAARAMAHDGDRLLFVGDGAIAYGDSILSAMGDRGSAPPPAFAILRPAQVGLLGRHLLLSGLGQDPRHLAPMYLRASEAEIKQRQGGKRPCGQQRSL
ncbi:MAG: tRNA (adenosine(37)-N6)-threonylcarbamoyltransferase complex dimerization subunit type 1 TsaB [Clostridia bacterium]|nr:tRNA (adenosine(37)-N6)-threonylcarbamoyltransferase complex dimerization subunit type 1 TsaB [Clostridia bacterium]